MPPTPLHYVAAYALYKGSGSRLNLPALVVGAMASDLEIPFLYLATGSLTTNRLLLHSLIGAGSLGVFITVTLTRYLYPKLVPPLCRLDEQVVGGRCRFTPLLAASAFLGVLTHPLIDALHHPYNPLLYPLTPTSIDSLVLFGDWVLASILINILFSAALALIVISELRGGVEGFWRRLLVGV